MNSLKIILLVFFVSIGCINAQQINFKEYDLANGLHVILHKDNTVPIVATSVMYHVGAKNEVTNRTGFAHFFEHLLFEGTKNIKKGQWDKIVTSHGGYSNANTTDDRTYFYDIFPSNNLKVGLWLESERMLHAVINKTGVDTQNKVVKEEKRVRYDNAPYGHLFEQIKINLFKKHPYRNMTIGKIEDLDSANLNEFSQFYKKYYIPNNATLVVAGDIDTTQTKKWILDYFADIPKGKKIKHLNIVEEPIKEEIKTSFEDSNIKIPAVIAAYRIPKMTSRESYVLKMISKILSDGKSSRFYKKIVDEKQEALQVDAYTINEEDYGICYVFAIPKGKTSLEQLLADIDEEIVKIQNNLISEKEYQKILNQIENEYVNSYSTVSGIASSLASYHVLYGNTSLINKEIDIYKSITREEIQKVAQNYLNSHQRLVLRYVPTKQLNN